MGAVLDLMRGYTDLVLFLTVWLGIALIAILRQKRQLESEVERRQQVEEDAIARASKGRLTNLDAIVSSQAGVPVDAGPSPIPVQATPARPAAPPSAPVASRPPHVASPPLFPDAPAPVAAPAAPHVPHAPAPAPAAAREAPAGEDDEQRRALLTQYSSGDGGGVEEMERMLQRDPNNLQLLDWLAFMYYSNNETEKAISTYSRIIEIEPNNASQHYYLGNCYFKHNEADKALAEWKTVLALKPNSKYARKAQERLMKVTAAVGPQAGVTP